MQTTHPFRFGIASRASTRDELILEAQKAEALGYSTLLFPDHLYNPLAPIAAMTTAAAVTKTLRIGSYVFGNDFRHPVQLAREMTTVDLLSDGRLEVGMGTGWQYSDYQQAGVALESPGTRVTRLAEAIQIMKRFWSGESFDYPGAHYQLQGLQGAPKPVQQPHPPLMIGGGSKRILSLAAREAAIVSINARTTAEGQLDFDSLTTEATAQKVAWVRQAAGDRFPALELNLVIATVVVTDNAEAVAEEMIRRYGLTGQTTTTEVLASPSMLIGNVEQIVERLQAWREQFGFSYFVALRGLEELAPVVAKVAGK